MPFRRSLRAPRPSPLKQKRRVSFCGGLAVLASEHDPGTNDDAENIRHSPEAKEGRAHEIASDPPVRGYLHWSLLDNLEATARYSPRFSLAAVDHTRSARTNDLRHHAHDSVVGDIPPGLRWT